MLKSHIWVFNLWNLINFSHESALKSLSLKVYLILNYISSLKHFILFNF